MLHRLVFNEMILNSLSWFFITSTSQCSEGINFDWLNDWKCWTLASKNVCMEESKIRLEKWRALEMVLIAKLIKMKVLLYQDQK